jgi:hypothetical protein
MWPRKRQTPEIIDDVEDVGEIPPNPLIDRFRKSIDAVISSNRSQTDDRSGTQVVTLTHPERWGVEFINYGSGPQGYEKPSPWTSFTPTYGIRVRCAGHQEFLFAAAEGDEIKLRRRFKSSSLMPPDGLRNLFTSERELDDEQVRSLISYTEDPYLHFEDLHRLLALDLEESAALAASNAEVTEYNRKLDDDLKELHRWQMPPGATG